MTASFRTATRLAFRRSLVGLAAFAACGSTIAAAQSTTVLHYEVSDHTTNANSTINYAETSQVLGGLPSDALVFVTASGAASYAGPLTGAGIRVSIRYAPKTVVTEDDMFEGQSIGMTYRASVSHICLLPLKQSATFFAMTERLGPLGMGGTNPNTNTQVRLEVVAIAARFAGPPRKTCGGAF